MSAAPSGGRNPWVAVVLSLFAPGLGHVYAGAIVRGLVVFVLCLLWAPLVVAAAYLPPSTTVLAGMILALLAVIGIDLFAAVDAYRTARLHRQHYEPRDYNRPLVYVLFVLLWLLYPAAALAYIRADVFEAFYLPTGSMAPNFLVGDHVLANKTAYRNRLPERGEAVVFRHPRKRGLTWIKRVIGLPGDTVEVKDNDVFVNGKKLERNRVPADALFAIRNQLDGDVYTEAGGGQSYLIMIGTEKSPDFPKSTVPEGTLFVLGDHRDRSSDSRDPEMGFVPLGDLLGRPQYVYYPAETWTRFGAVPDGGR
jgi:signal peptidase I